MRPAPPEFPLVADSGNLKAVIQKVAAAPLIAIDTEFVRERTYFPELCVLQIATRDCIAAIDCLSEIELEPLYRSLVSSKAPWVLHSARQDLEVLGQRFGELPTRLIDTQIAAALLGYPLQIGLQGLLSATLDISLGKEHTRADWSRRPLPDAVLRYALDDVRYLLPAWQTLESRLLAAGRLDWLQEDCRRLLELPIQAEPSAILERTKGAGALRGRHRAAALALLAWREERAMRRNKPRRWILADDPLVAIAQALPSDLERLAQVPGLPGKFVTRFGKAVLAAVQAAEAEPEPPQRITPERSAVKRLQSDVKAVATELGIQPELLATRKEIVLAASGQLPEAFTRGWRATALAPLVARLSSNPAS